MLKIDLIWRDSCFNPANKPLNHAKATTDNIQAKSDAIHSNARGSENYLIKSGETDVKK